MLNDEVLCQRRRKVLMSVEGVGNFNSDRIVNHWECSVWSFPSRRQRRRLKSGNVWSAVAVKLSIQEEFGSVIGGYFEFAEVLLRFIAQKLRERVKILLLNSFGWFVCEESRFKGQFCREMNISFVNNRTLSDNIRNEYHTKAFFSF